MASVSQAIADAVKTVIDDLDISLGTVAVRKSNVLHKTDTLPAIILSIDNDGGQQWATLGDGAMDFGSVGREYTCRIAVYREYEGLTETNVDANPDFVQTLKQELMKPFLGDVDEVYNVAMTPHPQFETGALREGCEVTKFQLTFQTSESLNGY